MASDLRLLIDSKFSKLIWKLKIMSHQTNRDGNGLKPVASHKIAVKNKRNLGGLAPKQTLSEDAWEVLKKVISANVTGYWESQSAS